MDVMHRRVRFRIGDVYYPKPDDLLGRLEPLFSDYELNGTVVATSEAGTPDGAFVEVELEGVDQVVIVPVSQIRVSSDGPR